MNENEKKLPEVIIFIDGHYLSLIAQSLNNLKIDFYKLSKALAKEEKLWWHSTYYYYSPPYQSNPPTYEERIKQSNYDKFINVIKQLKNFTVREGKCQKLPDGYHEKEVDILLTIDLMKLKFNKLTDKPIKNIILITTDSDFVPVIKELREDNINIILYYYNGSINNNKVIFPYSLSNTCNKTQELTPDLLRNVQLIKDENKDKNEAKSKSKLLLNY
ncbi:MAG: NYN domain-containing protein [Candidatus Micrarchaeia archaeon]